MTLESAVLLDADSFHQAGTVDEKVPIGPGLYAMTLRSGSSLPRPFDELLAARPSRLIYIGKASSLRSRMLRNELRGRGHGTFFRSIGAVLGFRPLEASLADKVNKQNYSFTSSDRDAIVEWIDANLDVSWCELPLGRASQLETALIVEHTPLLNLAGNPLALVQLNDLRVLCRRIAAEAVGTPR